MEIQIFTLNFYIDFLYILYFYKIIEDFFLFLKLKYEKKHYY